MNATVQIANKTFRIDPDSTIDISIPLNFNGPQPSAYGVEPASSKPCAYGTLVGDTRRGGSVNFEQYTLIPHCNGTHTECVGHITDERISVRDCVKDVLMLAVLASIEPQNSDGDLVISRASLVDAMPSDSNGHALIIRTLPNNETKFACRYDSENIPPYFTAEAMDYIVECGFKHLLVDMPSIDRLFDEGKLTNHRIFWNVKEGTFQKNENTRTNATITELIYVANDVVDGEYLLNLQIAPFSADAAPSRPLLFDVQS